ncbi:MAG: nicotinate (nicotinamide) nucleotide adenylyltransferase [Planctomycetota bacterium]
MPSDLSGYKTILLFGGSFDPPHRAHTRLPQMVAKVIGADLIAYIPAGRAPHKLDRVQTDPRHRLAMLRLALEDEPGEIPAKALTLEVERGADDPSYTVDTLETLSKQIDPGATLRLLIGADQLRIFDSWRNPKRIIELAEPVVMVRPPDTRASLLGSLASEERDGWADRLVEAEMIDLSSTQLRKKIAAGEPIGQWTPASVCGYIAKHGLYRDTRD